MRESREARPNRPAPETRATIVVALLLTAVSLAHAEPAAAEGEPAPPPVRETPFAPVDLVAARDVTVSSAFPFRGRAERPPVARGTLLVLEVDPAVALPRQVAEPVLYVGDAVAQYARRGYPSGRVIAFVPGSVDLEAAPIWFGTPELPDRVDATTVARERARAAEAGIGAFASGVVEAARRAGGAPIVVEDARGLERAAESLYERFVAPLAPRVQDAPDPVR